MAGQTLDTRVLTVGFSEDGVAHGRVRGRTPCISVECVSSSRPTLVQVRCTDQNALSHTIDAPNSSSHQGIAHQSQVAADVVFEFEVPAGLCGLGLGLGTGAVGLGDANDVHNFIVGAHHASVDTASLCISGTASFVVLLAGTSTGGVPGAVDDNVVRGAALLGEPGSKSGGGGSHEKAVAKNLRAPVTPAARTCTFWVVDGEGSDLEMLLKLDCVEEALVMNHQNILELGPLSRFIGAKLR